MAEKDTGSGGRARALTTGVSVMLAALLGALLVIAPGLGGSALSGGPPDPYTAQAAPAAADPPVVFAVIGDYGIAGPDEAAVAALVKSWNPAFIITTGDNNYTAGAAATIDQNIGQYYHEWISPYLGGYGAGADVNRFFPSLGNHDWVAPGAQPYLDYFTLPGNERYYEQPWGPVHLFAVDSDPSEPDGTTSGSVQAAWLQGRLAASTACWKLVYFHHAAYSSALHGSDTRMQWPFQAWGASAVLAGHDHSYERLDIGGLPYFVNGIGGQARYNFGPPILGSIVRYNSSVGAMRVTASRGSITYEFVAATGGPSGTLIDTHTVTGGCDGPAPPSPTWTPTATLTPTATSTATPLPTSTPTLVPTFCAPRPPVRQRLVRIATGQLQATISVSTSVANPANTLKGLRLTSTTNAVVDVGGLVGVSAPVDLPVGTGATEVTLVVRRLVDARAATVALAATDECGPWRTLVGGGASAF